MLDRIAAIAGKLRVSPIAHDATLEDDRAPTSASEYLVARVTACQSNTIRDILLRTRPAVTAFAAEKSNHESAS
jgi:hypothetical protein